MVIKFTYQRLSGPAYVRVCEQKILILATRKSCYNAHRGWKETEYQNKHYNIDQQDEQTYDDRGRDGGTKFILRIKEQKTRLTLHEHDDDDELC
jgi:hypothetical protein